jgi:hypothetical protein
MSNFGGRLGQPKKMNLILGISFFLKAWQPIVFFKDGIDYTGCPKNGGLTTYYRIQDV